MVLFRQLPAHDATVFSPKLHDYAVVIPVLNEGERIRSQLRRLRGMAFAVDIVVADGNSTDGSTQPTFMQDVGVRALLVKTGPGRLSAQLRMGYAWCLDQGYEGIITVDGNGKDGVDAIPRFIELLQAGYDYVQGSRYIKGGSGVNTPLDRLIAGRILHAPLISLAAKRHFTDTTNGFRAYSAKALADDRVAAFRSVFDSYNLLFYLSVRLPRLGYRCIETPVSRVYPGGGVTPTKITGARGRLAMLRELLIAVLGGYNPRL